MQYEFLWIYSHNSVQLEADLPAGNSMAIRYAVSLPILDVSWSGSLTLDENDRKILRLAGSFAQVGSGPCSYSLARGASGMEVPALES